METTLREELMRLERAAVRAGRPELVMQVQVIMRSLERIYKELERIGYPPPDRPER